MSYAISNCIVFQLNCKCVGDSKSGKHNCSDSECAIGSIALCVHSQSRSWYWTLALPLWSSEPDFDRPPTEWVMRRRTVKDSNWEGKKERERDRGREKREANDETLYKRNVTAQHISWHHAHYMNHLAQWHSVSDYLKLHNIRSLSSEPDRNYAADLVILSSWGTYKTSMTCFIHVHYLP